MPEPPTLLGSYREPLCVWYTGTETGKALYCDDKGLLVSVVGSLTLTPAVDQGSPNAGGADAWPVDTAPVAASAVGNMNFTVGATEAALSGTNARGYLLFNNSTSGQVIYFGDTGLSASTGFPLRPGDAIDRPTWQNLSVVFARASAAGADLRAVLL